MRGSHPVLSLRSGLKRHACPLANANSAGHLPNRVTMPMSATRSNQLLPRGGVCNTLFYIPGRTTTFSKTSPILLCVYNFITGRRIDCSAAFRLQAWQTRQGFFYHALFTQIQARLFEKEGLTPFGLTRLACSKSKVWRCKTV